MTDRNELERLLAAATEGPWGIWREPIQSRYDAIAELAEQVESTDKIADALVLLDAGGVCPATTGCGMTSEANAALICFLRNNAQHYLSLMDEVERLREAILGVVRATRDYLPPDGIDARECLSRILAATDNPEINAIIAAMEALGETHDN